MVVEKKNKNLPIWNSNLSQMYFPNEDGRRKFQITKWEAICGTHNCPKGNIEGCFCRGGKIN